MYTLWKSVERTQQLEELSEKGQEAEFGVNQPLNKFH